MSIKQLPGARPRTVLFDWHATLVDTHDAMYHAVEDVIPRLRELGLLERLVAPEHSRNLEDAKLVRYAREQARLPSRIKHDRKISRTDIFEVLFGDDDKAKAIAHRAFDDAYAHYVGEVHPLEPGIPDMLTEFRNRGIRVGILSNRKRDFMEHELSLVDGSGWAHLTDVLVCGDDVEHRKPAPDLLLRALERLKEPADTHCWYVGDSTTDIYAATAAEVTGIFYNGAGWDQAWLDKIFPGTVRHPARPDAVVGNFTELRALVRAFDEA